MLVLGSLGLRLNVLETEMTGGQKDKGVKGPSGFSVKSLSQEDTPWVVLQIHIIYFFILLDKFDVLIEAHVPRSDYFLLLNLLLFIMTYLLLRQRRKICRIFRIGLPTCRTQFIFVRTDSMPTEPANLKEEMTRNLGIQLHSKLHLT